uniref:Uncharacterized protein n=1 Tax=Avena sativa TaxID=4498 RepID=A0ACD5UJA3_AVESA
MEDARGMIIQYRQRIPAFGEWNYDHSVDDWSVLTQRFDSVRMMQQIPFPVHNKQPCRKRARVSRRRRVPAFGEWNNDDGNDNGEGAWTAAVNQCFEPAVAAHKSPKQVRDANGVVAMGMQQHKAWVADSGPLESLMEPFSFTVVEAVDDDLYEVPADMLCSKSMRLRGRTCLRSLLTTCFGLNCFG